MEGEERRQGFRFQYELVEKVREGINKDRYLSLKMLEYEYGANKEMIRQILVQDLGASKVCIRFLPHALSDDQKHEGVEYMQKTSWRLAKQWKIFSSTL